MGRIGREHQTGHELVIWKLVDVLIAAPRHVERHSNLFAASFDIFGDGIKGLIHHGLVAVEVLLCIHLLGACVAYGGGSNCKK